MISFRRAILLQILLQGVLKSQSLLVTPSTTTTTTARHSTSAFRKTTTATALHSHANNKNNNKNNNWIASTFAATSIAIAAATTNPIPPAQAYVPADDASETVEKAIQALKDSSGDVDQTFKAYERVAGIITEGEGVGGMVNYKGVQLERGYISDEDTSVYNPGLTLLTEDEKTRMVNAIVQSRKDGLSKGQWNENNEYAFEFLKSNLDPLHMKELRGYLGFVPFYAAILYGAVLAVQQFARGLFPAAYLIGIAAFTLPIIALIAAGP